MSEVPGTAARGDEAAIAAPVGHGAPATADDDPERAALRRLAARAAAPGEPLAATLDALAAEARGLLAADACLVAPCDEARWPDDVGVAGISRELATERLRRRPHGAAPAGGPGLAAGGGVEVGLVVDGGTWGWLAADGAAPAGRLDLLGRLGDLATLVLAGAVARDELARQTVLDPLTGLLGLRAFHDRLAAEIAQAARHRVPLALCIVDVDGMRAVNDGHGHLAGDEVLVEVARRLAAECRRGDVVARVGGEEFACLLPHANAAAGGLAAERLHAAVGARPFGAVGRLAVSVGVAALAAGEDVLAFHARADAALYAAKEAGRDRVVVAAEAAAP